MTYQYSCTQSDKVIVLDSVVELERQKHSNLQALQPAPTQAPTASMAVEGHTSECPKTKNLVVSKGVSRVVSRGRWQHDESLAQGGRLPNLLGCPTSLLSTLAKSAGGPTKLSVIDEDSLADCETCMASTTQQDASSAPIQQATRFVAAGSTRRSSRKLCSNTRLIRAIRNRPYHRRR